MRERTLTRRLAMWIAATFAVSMIIFAAIAYLVVYLEERAEIKPSEESSAEIASDARDEVLTALAAAAPVGLLLSVGGAVWLARRAMAPVKAVIRAATDISADQLDRRIPVPAAADEIRELIIALNALLERLQAGFLAQSRFAESASHELRTPLAVVANQLEVALRRPRSAEEWTATGREALDEVHRLSRLVDALLLLRRSEALRPEAAATADLSSVLDQVITRAAGSARAAQVSLRSPDVGPLVVVGDAEHFEIAVANVVANAIKASPPGSSVTFSVDGARGERVELHIDDQGPGLAQDDRERVFAPFVRGRGGAGEEGGGIGLGLTIARQILESAGGSLSAGAAPGGGARLSFTFLRVTGVP